jgi:hypothetical protein
MTFRRFFISPASLSAPVEGHKTNAASDARFHPVLRLYNQKSPETNCNQMKKICIALMLLTALAAQAQQRKWENKFYAGAGLMASKTDADNAHGLALQAGYALTYHFSRQWSLMPGVAVRNVAENGFGSSADGADDDVFTFLDIPLLVQHRVGSGKGSTTLGLGPVFSFCVDNDAYYIDAEPQSPLNKLAKCNLFSLGLQPSLDHRLTNHFSLGLDAYICLTNLKRNHGLTSGSKRIHCLTAHVAWTF